MEEKLLYAVAELDEATGGELNQITKALDSAGLTGRQTRGIPYHITLASFPLCQEAQVIGHLTQICSKIPPFDITLSHIGLFGLQVLFAAPSVNLELLELYDQTISPGFVLRDDYEWVAHTTILIDDADSIQKALPIVVNKFQPMYARVYRIGLYAVPPAQMVATFNLTGKH